MKRRHRSGQRGDAMVLVILAVLLLTLIPAALVAATMGQVPQAREEQQYQGALAAAEAGVADYLNLLDQASVNQTQSYWTYDGNNLPPGGNAAMTSWEGVPGSSSEYFHYTVDNTNTASSGVVTLTSTGVAVHGIETEYQTVQVEIRSETFLNYVDMMSQMLIDPQFAPDTSNMSVNQAEQYCEYNYDQYNPSTGQDGPDMNDCSSLINYYSSGEVVNGAIFTNDIYYLTGTPVFNGAVLSGSSAQTPYTSHPYWLDPLSYYYGEGVSDDPTFNDGPIEYHAPLQFPTANAQLATVAQSDGCYYEGPTSIDVTGNTMTVDSPETTTATNGCPTDGSGALPANGVIYIAPDSSTTQRRCTIDLEGQAHACTNGDALVQGDVTGQLTIAATNNVDITGNLLDHGCAQPDSSSVIGLIADNFVQVADNVFPTYNYYGRGTPGTNVTPNSCAGETGASTSGAPGNGNTLVVQAAILALNQSFAVQDFWNIPVQGNLDLDGSIAGYYADIEGSFSGSNGQLSSGYNVIYTYDKRLTYMQPPYFLTPVAADWQKISFTQIDPPSGLPALP